MNKKKNISEEELAKTQPLKKITEEEIKLKEEIELKHNKKDKTEKNKKIIYICLGIIGLLLIIIIILLSLILKNNYEKQNNDKKELKELNSKEYQAIIDSYAASVDIAVQNYIQTNNGDIPEFSDIEKLIVFESYKVSCEDSQINYDKSIYLANCKINNYKENANIVYGKKLTPPPQSGKNLYFYKVTSTYQDPSTGQTETQTYYNSYKELYTNQNPNVYGEMIGIYACQNENCKAYDIDNKNLDVIIEDNTHYLYNITTKTTSPIANLPSTEYSYMKFIKNDQNSTIIALTANGKSTLFNVKTGTDLTNFKYTYITSHEVLTNKGFVTANIENTNDTYLIDINNGIETKVIKNIKTLSEFRISQQVLYKAYAEESINPTHIIYDDNFEPLIKEFKDYTYTINSNGTLLVVPNNSKKFYIYSYTGEKIYTSKEYNSIKKIVKDHIIILDENNDLKIYNTKEEELATLLNVKENHHLHPMISGWYTENGKNGIYFVVENKNVPFGTLGSGLEYYYIPETKETGVIETEGVGGYAKPVLYLYPTKETKVTINFEHKNLLTTTYPKFKNNWKVTAKPNGDLYDNKGNYYYGLYWEELGSIKVDFKDGFYVEKNDAIEFLEEKLNRIGLNARERNEFIMYWLPILEKNEKNLVYFELTDSRENYNKLLIEPKPDSLLRIAIHIKKVDKKQKIKEQQLPTFKRNGFTAIEWGGVQH